MRSLLRIALLLMLLAGAEGVHAQVVDPAPGEAPVIVPEQVPLTQEGVVQGQFEPPMDTTAHPTIVRGPHIRVRLRPVRFSMKDIVDQITLEDIFDALSRL